MKEREVEALLVEEAGIERERWEQRAEESCAAQNLYFVLMESFKDVFNLLSFICFFSSELFPQRSKLRLG